MMAPLFVLAAGGTGGHMFPAEALACELRARGYRVALVTDRRGRSFDDHMSDVAVHRIHAASVLGRGILKRLRAMATIALGLVEAGWLLRRLKPAVVIGFGGYPSVPTLLAASLTKVPIVVHEQNAVLGRANRALAPRAAVIATSFAETEAIAPSDRAKIAHTGNPVRAQILDLATHDYEAPRDEAALHMVVTGGSQGARIFADVVPSAVASLPKDMRDRLQITQQCRAEDLERAANVYAQAEVVAELAPFFADIASRLKTAHVVICRAGASTLAELTVAGLPSILVPLPSAIDDHQTINALPLIAAGAGWLMAQDEFTPSSLARRLFTLMREPETLKAASVASRRLSIVDAAERLADVVERLGLPGRVSETVGEPA
jgi:UDP-N-acetylglucosamine--N-acetylmuramyl-(pentapeptide) pyrophosphoryl-undecaprenol N-acetylglucosamine transferase